MRSTARSSGSVLSGIAAQRGSNDVVDDLRLLNPAQVAGTVKRDDPRLRQSAREMSGVLVGHHAVRGTVHDYGRLDYRSARQPTTQIGTAGLVLRPPALGRRAGARSQGQQFLKHR